MARLPEEAGRGQGRVGLGKLGTVQVFAFLLDWPRREELGLIWSKKPMPAVLLPVKRHVERCGWADGVRRVFLRPPLPSPPFSRYPRDNYGICFAAKRG